MMTFLIIVALIAVAVFFVVILYNNLIKLRNSYKNSFAQIDVQLKRRYDLIPNLVEAAKGYLTHERETLEAVTSARNQAMTASKAVSSNLASPEAMQTLAAAEVSLAGSLGKLFAVVESYPDLKANQNMMQLMDELAATENKISFARQSYNDSVMSYNNAREVFPNNMVAGIFDFNSVQLFEVESAEEKKVVKVSFP